MTRKTRRSNRSGRGALVVIAAILAASGLVRLGSGTGLAVAREVEALTKRTSDTHAPAQCEPAPDIAALFAALQKREAKVTASEAVIAERQQTVSVAEEEIMLQLEQLRQAESALRSTLALAESAAEDDLARLTTVYENMKPKDAAALFEQMAPEFAAGFMGRMRPDAAAEIMTGLNPATAYSLSVILAGRNASVPKE